MALWLWINEGQRRDQLHLCQLVGLRKHFWKERITKQRARGNPSVFPATLLLHRVCMRLKPRGGVICPRSQGPRLNSFQVLFLQHQVPSWLPELVPQKPELVHFKCPKKGGYSGFGGHGECQGRECTPRVCGWEGSGQNTAHSHLSCPELSRTPWDWTNQGDVAKQGTNSFSDTIVFFTSKQPTRKTTHW